MMTDEQLTALWREAGRPIVDGLQMANGDVVSSAAGREFVTPSGLIEPGLLGSHTPDWSHFTTESAMMCAAEQAAGCLLMWVRMPRHGPWYALRADGASAAGGIFCETRTELALRVIIAARGDGHE